MNKTTVVKLGGSSIGSPHLRRWIAAIEQADAPLVVVPGGGPFAEVGRRFQVRLGFDDRAAHEMATLAMEQFGCALANLSERLVGARSMEAIGVAHEAGRIPVWLPHDMVMADPDIPQDWSVTSDALSAWLAGQFEEANLCLVKLIDVPANSNLDALTGASIVDDSFASMLRPGTDLFIAGPLDLVTAGQRFAIGGVPGRQVATRLITARSHQAIAG